MGKSCSLPVCRAPSVEDARLALVEYLPLLQEVEEGWMLWPLTLAGSSLVPS